MSALEQLKALAKSDQYRVGRKLGRTIYRKLGQEASDDDQLIGIMDDPAMGREVVDALNSPRWLDVLALIEQAQHDVQRQADLIAEFRKITDVRERIQDRKTAELAEARSAIERVKTLHQPATYDGHSVVPDETYCKECGEESSGSLHPWPCPTRRAIDGGDSDVA